MYLCPCFAVYSLGKAAPLQAVCSEFSRTHTLWFRQTCILVGVPIVRTACNSKPQVISRRACKLRSYPSHPRVWPFAPEALTRWTVETSSFTVLPLVDRYGLRTALMSFPGSKLYLLLQKNCPRQACLETHVRQALLPRSLPPAIRMPVAAKDCSHAFDIGKKSDSSFSDCAFHLLEGVRYFASRSFGQRYRNGASQ